MTEHISHLHPESFIKIKSSRKDIEVRLNDEKRRQLKLGDNIRFINRENGEEVICKIVGLCRFQDIITLAQTLGVARLGYEKWTPEKYNEFMEQHYTKEEIIKYGALGIVLGRLGV